MDRRDLDRHLDRVADEIRWSRQTAANRWAEDQGGGDAAVRGAEEEVARRHATNPARWQAERLAARLNWLWYLGCLVVAGVGVRELFGGSGSDLGNFVGLVASLPGGLVLAVILNFFRRRWMTSRYGPYEEPEESKPAQDQDPFSTYLRETDQH